VASLPRAMLVASVTLVAGCTFLIDFKEVDRAPPADDADARAANDGSVGDEGVVAFPPPCDPSFPLAEVRCNASFPRPNCASNTGIFPSYPTGHPRADDLVTCNGGTKPTCVQHCPFGCVAMPQGFPDACDDCDGRADGTYCVKDLRGPDGRSLGLAVDCKGGRTVEGHICGVGRCATKCPRADLKPSCCN
jgi:hypothetical protein